jgi:hypothetical protein
MNQLLDRYLHAVRSRLSATLPEEQQEDIVRELSENLAAQIEDREADLGRPLNDAEYARLLEDHGHPIAVAGRYLQLRPLIGPQLLPHYWFSLRMMICVAACVMIVVLTLMPFIARTVQITEGRAVPTFMLAPTQGITTLAAIGTLFAMFGMMTLVFIVLELCMSRFGWPTRWNPRHLPPVSSYAHVYPRARFLTELIFSAFFAAILLAAKHPRIGPWQSTPVWEQFRIALLVITGANVVIAAARLLRPHRAQFWAIARLFSSAASLAVFYTFAQTAPMLMTADPKVTTAVLEIANRAVTASLLLAFWIAILDFSIELWRLVGPLVGRHIHRLPSRA